jgi:hypothetical protein
MFLAAVSIAAHSLPPNLLCQKRSTGKENKYL